MQRLTYRFLAVAALPLLYIGGMLLYGTVNDWQPAPTAELGSQTAAPPLDTSRDLRLLIWNLGYAGLGAESDFFYDQGGFFIARQGHIRMPRELVEKNLRGITAVIGQAPADFYLLQEIDSSSRRSHYLNELAATRQALPGYQQAFAANYRVKHVPIPLFEPWRQYGRVHSGLASYTRHTPSRSRRLSLPGSFGWPTRLFQLDRCLLVQRFPTTAGRELVLVNLHLSAYDADGSLKYEQLDFLRQLAIAEYEQGNYVVLGGDWNMCPPDFPYDTFYRPGGDRVGQLNIDADFFPAGWQYAYDRTTPSNRKTNRPYDPDRSFRTIIDYYVVSPNLRVEEVRGVDLDFAYSDHQPVQLRLSYAP
jgi:endonuclease/exonuclease/phosphatase family metal-dependent hydrolase